MFVMRVLYLLIDNSYKTLILLFIYNTRLYNERSKNDVISCLCFFKLVVTRQIGSQAILILFPKYGGVKYCML